MKAFVYITIAIVMMFKCVSANFNISLDSGYLVKANSSRAVGFLASEQLDNLSQSLELIDQRYL